MIHLRQHIPTYNDAAIARVAVARTIAELVKIPWVATYTNMDNKSFYRWSRSDHMLMAEFDTGNSWQVVGYLSVDTLSEVSELPLWKDEEERHADH